MQRPQKNKYFRKGGQQQQRLGWFLCTCWRGCLQKGGKVLVLSPLSRSWLRADGWKKGREQPLLPADGDVLPAWSRQVKAPSWLTFFCFPLGSLFPLSQSVWYTGKKVALQNLESWWKPSRQRAEMETGVNPDAPISPPVWSILCCLAAVSEPCESC